MEKILPKPPSRQMPFEPFSNELAGELYGVGEFDAVGEGGVQGLGGRQDLGHLFY